MISLYDVVKLNSRWMVELTIQDTAVPMVSSLEKFHCTIPVYLRIENRSTSVSSAIVSSLLTSPAIQCSSQSLFAALHLFYIYPEPRMLWEFADFGLTIEAAIAS